MTKLFKRIVVGIGDNGQGFIEADDRPPVTFAMEDQYPGYNNVEIWETTNVPADCYYERTCINLPLSARSKRNN